MTSDASMMVNQILSMPKHKKYEYRVIDSTEMFYNVLAYLGMPNDKLLDMNVESTSYDVFSGEEAYSSAKIKDTFGSELIELFDSDDYIGDAKECYEWVCSEEENVEDHLHFSSFLLIPFIDCQAVCNQGDFKILYDMADYMQYVSAILNGATVDNQANDPEVRDAINEYKMKYFVHVPFDHCIFIFDSMAYVYDKTSENRAHLLLYSLTNKKLARVSHTQFVLNEQGGLEKAYIPDRRIPNQKFLSSYDDTDNYISGENLFNAPLVKYISTRYLNTAKICNYIKENDESYYGEIHKMFSFSLLMEYTLDFAKTLENKTMDTVARLQSIYGDVTHPLVYAFAISIIMMTCKQVRLRENSTIVKKPSNPKKKKSKGGSASHRKITYSTISIHMEDQIIDKDGNYIVENNLGESDDREYKRARHMRRGHFAYYTEDKPLFGKISGLVWRSPTIINAGNTNESKADYSVKL